MSATAPTGEQLHPPPVRSSTAITYDPHRPLRTLQSGAATDLHGRGNPAPQPYAAYLCVLGPMRSLHVRAVRCAPSTWRCRRRPGRIGSSGFHRRGARPGLTSEFVWGQISCSTPRKRMSLYFVLEWGVQIHYNFHENQTPRSDSANLEPSEPIFCPQKFWFARAQHRGG